MNFNKNAVNQMKKEDSKFGEKSKKNNMAPHQKIKNPPPFSRMKLSELADWED